MTTSPKTVFRMRARGPTIALIISSVFVASCMESKDTGVDTAIREAARQKCEDQAVQWLRWVTPIAVEAQNIIFGNQNTINSHYNERMKTCLVHHKFGDFERIVNIKENNTIAKFERGGLFNPGKPNANECWVGEQKCKSLEEWKTLIAPYMEE